MTADQRYELIRIKVERSKEHIRELEAEINSYHMSNPYLIRTKRDPETQQLIYYLASLKDIPLRIAAITGDTINNLRSSLDHLAHQLVIVGGGIPTRQTTFPIFKDASSYQANAHRVMSGMRQNAIDAIDATKPYKGGNETLWLIHNLNNIDKHRIVLAVYHRPYVDLAGHPSRDMRQRLAGDPDFANIVAALDAMPPGFFREVGENVLPLKEGDELFIDSPDAEFKENMQFLFEIAFSEPGVVEGQPILITLRQMFDVVNNLITDFKPLIT